MWVGAGGRAARGLVRVEAGRAQGGDGKWGRCARLATRVGWTNLVEEYAAAREQLQDQHVVRTSGVERRRCLMPWRGNELRQRDPTTELVATP